jgi:hypothetical protein
MNPTGIFEPGEDNTGFHQRWMLECDTVLFLQFSPEWIDEEFTRGNLGTHFKRWLAFV